MVLHIENKLLLDENLSKKLLGYLLPSFPDSIHVSDKALINTVDKLIWDFARDNSYAILTKDTDFNYLSTVYGCPPKVIRLNCGNQTTTYIAMLLRSKAELIKMFLQTAEVCLLEIYWCYLLSDGIILYMKHCCQLPSPATWCLCNRTILELKLIYSHLKNNRTILDL